MKYTLDLQGPKFVSPSEHRVIENMRISILKTLCDLTCYIYQEHKIFSNLLYF